MSQKYHFVLNQEAIQWIIPAAYTKTLSLHVQSHYDETYLMKSADSVILISRTAQINYSMQSKNALNQTETFCLLNPELQLVYFIIWGAL